jgi:hypothetical protein
MTHPRTREIRLRETAKRRGLTLEKSRKRDPLALGYGKWWLWTAKRGKVVLGGKRTEGATLDEVEAYLTGQEQGEGQ